MLSIIDRYILRSFVGYFIGGLITFVSMFLAIDFSSNMVKLKATGAVMLSYYSYHAPTVVVQMIPVACILATIFTLSSLNKSNELVAMFSSGYSLARISAPILTFVSVISVISFLVTDRLLPTLNQKKNYVYFVDIKKQPGLYSTVKTNRIWYRSGNILFNLKTLNAADKSAQGATFYYFDDAWNLVQMLSAKTVKMIDKQWNLSDGVISLFVEESSFPLTQSFKQKTIAINEGTNDIQASNTAEVMTIQQLKHFIQKNKEAGLDTLNYEVDYHSKFSFAFAAFVMSFIGIPFSVTRQRGGGVAKNLGICLGLVFLYWAIYSSGLTMARHGAVPVMIGVWAPNMAMIAMTMALLLRLKK